MSEPSGRKLNEAAQALLAYWRACRGDAVLPHREHISPEKLRRWIGDLSILHIHDGEKRFYVALHGQNVVRHMGPGFNRRYLEDVVPSASHSFSFAPYIASLEKRVPMFHTMEPNLSNGLVSRLTRLAFPFCDADPDKVSRFLVYVEPEDNRRDASSLIYSSICEVQQPDELPAPFAIYDDFNGDDVMPDEVSASVAPAGGRERGPTPAQPRRRLRLLGGLLGALERG